MAAYPKQLSSLCMFFLRFVTFPSDKQYFAQNKEWEFAKIEKVRMHDIYLLAEGLACIHRSIIPHMTLNTDTTPCHGGRWMIIFFNLKPAVFAEESYKTNSSKACPAYFFLERVISCSRRCHPTGRDNFPRASVECYWHGKSGFPHDWNTEYLDWYIQEWWRAKLSNEKELKNHIPPYRILRFVPSKERSKERRYERSKTPYVPSLAGNMEYFLD